MADTAVDKKTGDSFQPAQAPLSWLNSLAAFLQGKVLAMLAFGFSSGLPLPLIFGSLSLWLREAGVARSTITLFSWAALSYSFKFIWAPVIDHLPLPWLTARLGRRRAWLLLAQLAVAGALLFMAHSDPGNSLVAIGWAAALLGFTAATQDIVTDAYRIEASPVRLQAIMSSTYIAGYRLGMLVGGAGSLAMVAWLSGPADAGYDFSAWSTTYSCMAAAMLVGVVTTLSVREPEASASRLEHSVQTHMRFLLFFISVILTFVLIFSASGAAAASGQAWLAQQGVGAPVAVFISGLVRVAVSLVVALLAGRLMTASRLVPTDLLHATYVLPFQDFFRRFGKAALLMFLLIGTYRISDIVMGAVAHVFYSDMGYSLEQIAATSKTFGLVMTLCGGFVGGLLTLRYGVMKSLWWGAFLSASSNALFAILAETEPNIWALAAVIAADNLSSGIAGTSFVAYLSGLTNRTITATQYALFSSLMTAVPKLLAGYSGTLVDVLGYPSFFIFSAMIGLPVLLLIRQVSRYSPDEKAPGL